MLKWLALLSLVSLNASAAPEATAPLSGQTFSSAYRAILERSLRIETQRRQIDASEARRLAQWGSLAPSLSFEVNQKQAGESPSVGPLNGAALTTTVNLFRSGADLAGIQAARENLRANREKLLNERQLVEEDALSALVTFIGRVRARQINEKIVQLRAESLRIAKERYDRGLLAMQEVDKVAIDLDNSRAKLIDAQAREAEGRALLKSALGHDAIAIEWPWKDSLVKSQDLDKGLFDLERRPDWRQLKASVEEQKGRRRQALGQLLPSLSFSASLGNSDLANSGRRDWGTLLTLSVPIFEGLRDYSNFQVQGLELQVAEYRLEALRRLAPAEVESLKENHRAARESALAREKTAKVSERLFSDNQQRFRLGRATVNELAFDQDRLLQSQLLEIEGWLNLHLTYARLCHGLGGFVVASSEVSLSCEPAEPIVR